MSLLYPDMTLFSPKLVLGFSSWLTGLAIAASSVPMAQAELAPAPDSNPTSLSLMQAGIAVAQSANRTPEAKLERMSFLALQRFQAHDQLGALRFAMQIGEMLRDRVHSEQPLSQYPALMPILALQTILDQMHESGRVPLDQPVESLMPRPDGAGFATHNYPQNHLTLWDWSGRVTQQLPGAYGTSFSSNGDTVTTVAIDENQTSTVRLWNVATGQALGKVELPSFIIRTATGTQGDRMFTQAMESSKLQIWNLSGQLVAEIDHQSFIDRIEVSPDGQQITTMSGDGRLVMWSMDGAELARIEEVVSADFSSDGQQLLIATRAGAVQIWEGGGPFRSIASYEPNSINQVTLSPAGDRIAVGLLSNHVRLVDLSGNEIAAMEGTRINFSPDGRWLATTDSNQQLWFRDPVTGSVLAASEPYTNPLIYFSADSRRMAIVDAGRQVELWNIAGEKSLRDGAGILTIARRDPIDQFPIVSASDRADTMAMSPDLSRLVTLRSNQVISLWAVDPQPPLAFQVPIPSDIAEYYNVQSIRFTPTANQLIIDDSLMWDWQSQRLMANAGPVPQSFSADGRYAVDPIDPNQLAVFDLMGDRPIAALTGSQAVFSPNHSMIVTTEPGEGFDEQTLVRVWDLSGQQLGQFSAPFVLPNIIFSPDGQRLAITGLNSNMIMLWDAATASAEGAIALDHGSGSCCLGISQIAFSPDGEMLATTTEGDAVVKLWHFSGPMLAELPGHQQVSSMTFSPDGERIVTADPRTGRLRFWSRDGELLAQGAGDTEQAWSIKPLPDGQTFLAIGHGSGLVTRWSWSGESLGQFSPLSDSPDTVIVSPDQHLVAIANTSQDSTTLWTITGENRADLPGHIVAFSADSQTVATGNQEGSVQLTTHSGEMIASFAAHTAAITTLVFSPDGQRLATGSQDGTIRLWTVSGDLIGQWRMATSSNPWDNVVGAIAFSADGTKLAAVNGDNWVQVWQVDGLLGLLERGQAWLGQE